MELFKLEDEESTYGFDSLFVNYGFVSTITELMDLHSKDKRCNYVNISQNYGKEVDLFAGFGYSCGDYIDILDIDLQHLPFTMHEWLRKWEEECDDNYVRRAICGKEIWLRKQLSKTFHYLSSKSSRIGVLLIVRDFRILDRCCIDVICKIQVQNCYTKGMYCCFGFKHTRVCVETQYRVVGESSMSSKVLVKLAIEGLTSYTTSSLQWAIILGTIVVCFFFFIYLVDVDKNTNMGVAVGFLTIKVAKLFLGGARLLSSGIIGEYLGPVNNEIKNCSVCFVQ